MPGASGSDPTKLCVLNGLVLCTWVTNALRTLRSFSAIHHGGASGLVGTGCSQGSTPPTLRAGDPVLGTTMQLDLAGGPPSGVGAPVVGPLFGGGQYLGSGCTLHVGLPAATVPFVLDAGGAFAQQLSLTNGVVLRLGD